MNHLGHLSKFLLIYGAIVGYFGLSFRWWWKRKCDFDSPIDVWMNVLVQTLVAAPILLITVFVWWVTR